MTGPTSLDDRREEPPTRRADLPGGVFPGPGAARRRWTRPRHLNSRWRKPRTAFVFAGGGARGAAQIGMLQALVARGITPDDIYGASVGAVNAAGFAGDPTAAGVERMAALWRKTTSADVFPPGPAPRHLRFLQQREAVHGNEGLRRLIEAASPSAASRRPPSTSKWWPPPSPTVVPSGSPTAPPSRPSWPRPPSPRSSPRSRSAPRSSSTAASSTTSPSAGPSPEGPSASSSFSAAPSATPRHRYRRPVEAVLTAFFIAIHAKFARELEHLPPGVEVIVFSVDSDPVSRYHDFSGTEALIAAGRANADTILDFWQSGGRGSGTNRPPVSDPVELETTSGEAV
jgi:hypothetical protein